MSRLADALLRAAGEGRIPGPPAHHAEEADTPFSSPWDLGSPPEHVTPGPHPTAPTRPGAAVRTGLIMRAPLAQPSVSRPQPRGEAGSEASIRLDSLLAQKWQPFAPEVIGRLVVTPVSHVAVDQYRHAAKALDQAQKDRGVRTILVASAVAGEGRTLTAANLALTLSEACGRRVLLIDADLRQPQLHYIFQVSAGAGLAGYVRASFDDPPPLIELTKNLKLLPAGRMETSPEEVFEASRVRRLFDEMTSRFDWVILDSAPVCEQPDAAALARWTDGVVLVVKAGRTPIGTIQQAVDSLGREGLVGVLLNQAEPSAVQSAPSLATHTAPAFRLS